MGLEMVKHQKRPKYPLRPVNVYKFYFVFGFSFRKFCKIGSIILSRFPDLRVRPGALRWAPPLLNPHPDPDCQVLYLKIGKKGDERSHGGDDASTFWPHDD